MLGPNKATLLSTVVIKFPICLFSIGTGTFGVGAGVGNYNTRFLLHKKVTFGAVLKLS